MEQCAAEAERDFGSKLAAQLLHLHRLRTECSGLQERAAALRVEKLQLEKALEKQEGEHQATSRHVAAFGTEKMLSLAQHGEVTRMAQSDNISLMDHFLRVRTQFYKVKEQLQEEKAKHNVQQPELENLDTEMQTKLEGLIDKNMASLNLEQDEWSKALHQMASLSTGMVLGRADIDQKCCKVEEKARVVEEEVWHRQASTVSLNSSSTKSHSRGGFVPTGELAQQKVDSGRSWQEKVVVNIQVKEAEMENLTAALVRSKKMVSELRTCHVSSATHQQEIELKTELMEVEKMWIREKAELEEGLQVERERIAQLARELGES